MSHSFSVPVSAKLRLCQPSYKTLELAQRIEASGAAWITLHARTVSSRRRRQGAADLSEVKRLKDNLRVPVISNGNVRVFQDLQENLDYTGADGLMVGETLLGNPWFYSLYYKKKLTDRLNEHQILIVYLWVLSQIPSASLWNISISVENTLAQQLRQFKRTFDIS